MSMSMATRMTLLGVALLALPLASSSSCSSTPGLPMVINTWSGPFIAATDAAFTLLNSSSAPGAALDAVEAACQTCQTNRCDGSVGYGGSPDENCETTLDALIIDGDALNSGAVAALRDVKDAVGVARAVMERTRHSLLAGGLATAFAVEQGFERETLGTGESRRVCEDWRRGGCVPNYREDGVPPSCRGRGPGGLLEERRGEEVGHDTLSVIAITGKGSMAAATTTNGARHKVPGRVGDGPIMGSGSYVDSEVGGCGATGDGDYMLRFLPCYQAVENLRLGMSPREAAEDAVKRMVRRFPDISSGIVVVDREGRHGGAGSGWTFSYSYRGGDMKEAKVVQVPPLRGSQEL